MLRGILGFGNENALNYPKFLFCGSFNPLHEGHIAIADYVFNQYGVPIDFEISLHNVEKRSIDLNEINRRHMQIASLYKPSFGRIYITDDARYLEKARTLPEVTFVCGFDTMQALCSGCYYKETSFSEVMKEFDELAIKWLVFPRHKGDGTISELSDLKYFPTYLLENTKFVSDFKPINISSRELRE